MELRHLRYFVAVGEARSFTRAATELRVAQPALSRDCSNVQHFVLINFVLEIHNLSGSKNL